MENLSRGKVALKASLMKLSPSKKTRTNPHKDALFWCDAGLDKDGFKKRYINDEIGYGVFATKDVRQGDFLMEYVGERISPEEADARARLYSKAKKFSQRCYIYHFKYKGETKCVDATKTKGRLCHFINDAPINDKECNAKMKLKVFDTNYPRLCLFAIKDIKAGDEIRYDYGDDEESLFWRWKSEVTIVMSASGEESDDDPFGLDIDQTEVKETEKKTTTNETEYVEEREETPDILLAETDLTQSVEVSDPEDPEYVCPSSDDDDASSEIERNYGLCLGQIAQNLKENRKRQLFDNREFSDIQFTDTEAENVTAEEPAYIATRLNEKETIQVASTRTKCSEVELNGSQNTEILEYSHSAQLRNGSRDRLSPSSLHSEIIQNNCVNDFKQLENTQNRMPSQTSDELTCQICSKVFKKKGALSTHMRSHGTDKDKEYKKPKRPCPFCGVQQSRLRRHIESKHQSEPEVIEALEFPKGSRERDEMFDKMRKNGILQFNKGQAGEEEPNFMSERKGHADVLCSKCKGFYGKGLFFRHKDTCTGDSSQQPIKIKASAILDHDCEFTRDILTRFQDDEVGNICRNDPALLTIGKRLFQKSKRRVDKEMECRKSVMQDMRLLARLYQSFKSHVSFTKTVEDMFHRRHFEALERSIEDITKDGDKLKHGVKHSLYYLLKASCVILKGHHAVLENDDKMKDIDNFLSVYELHADIIFSDAIYAINLSRQEKLRMPEQQADENDIEQLSKHQKAVIKDLSSPYSFTGPHEFIKLRDSVCSRITMFNGRRGGEPSRLKLTHYKDAISKRWLNAQDVEKLEDWEQKLFDELPITYQTGKGNHLVPCLFPCDCLEALKILADPDIRERVGVLKENVFLFPNLGKSVDHVLGWDAANKLCVEAGVSDPSKVTASKNRHRISTIYSALALPESDRDFFYKHMGHSKNVNEGTYQYPLPILEVTRVGKHLQNIDRGTMPIKESTSQKEIEPLLEGLERDVSDEKETCGKNNDVTETGATGEIKFPSSTTVETGFNDREEACRAEVPVPKCTVTKKKDRDYFKWTSEETEQIKKDFSNWINVVEGNRLPCMKVLQEYTRLHKTRFCHVKLRTKIMNEQQKRQTLIKNRLKQMQNKQ